MIILNFECWLIAYVNAKQQKYFKTALNLHRYKYHVLLLLFSCVNQGSEGTMTSKAYPKFTFKDDVIRLTC